MANSTDDDDPILEKLLARTPTRVIGATAGNDPAVHARIKQDLEALAALALSLDPVAPTSSLRARIAAAAETVKVPPPRRAAVLVVDMLKDHLTPGAPLEVERARDVVPALKARIAEAHAAHEPVVYLVDHHELGDPELDAWPLHNVGDPVDEIWPELAPAAQDTIVTHRTYSGFFETRLDEVLRAMQVNTLVITGCITEIHMYATALDALQRGYRVEVPEDCQAGSSILAERTILATLSALAPSVPRAAFESQ
jgi:nicotinamidase-related amidase